MRRPTFGNRCVLCEPLQSRLLLSGGDPDTGFSNDGFNTLNFPGGTFQVLDTAFQPDGKLIAAGTKSGNIALTRFNVDGSLDTTFGSGGLFESSRRTQATEVLVQPDYKILIAFGVATQGFTNAAVCRVLANGTAIDSAFGDNGIAHTSQWGPDTVNDIALQQDGKIIAVGNRIADDRDFTIVRYNTNGSPDNTFDNDAIVTATFGDNEDATAVDIDYNGTPSTNPYWGKIVVVGNKWSGSNPPTRVVLCRVNTNGSFDNSFDGDGKITSPDLSINPNENATGVICQPGGKIVLTGSAMSSVSVLNDFLMARYLPNGALDGSFGPSGDGIVQSDFGNNEAAIDAAPNFHGGFLVSGKRGSSGLVAGYTRDGLLDALFGGGDGWMTTPFSGSVTVDTTLRGVAPIRRIAIASGSQVGRYWDVGSTVAISTYDASAAELGQDRASIYVERLINPGIDERIYISIGGTAAAPFFVSGSDYHAENMVITAFDLGSYIDVPSFFSGVGADIVPVNDAFAESNETVIMSISPNDAYDIAPGASTVTMVIQDDDNPNPPHVINSQFLLETLPQRVQMTFNEPVNVDPTDFEITGPPGVQIPAHTTTYNSTTRTVTLSFNAILKNGAYTARAIAYGIRNLNNAPMANDHVFNFFFLQGDADHNGVVNFDDFARIDNGFNNHLTGFSNGDFNYDGVINFDDYSIIDFAFNSQ